MTTRKPGPAGSGTFDPWTATLEEGLARFGAPGISDEEMAWITARSMTARKAEILSSGRSVMDAVAQCAASRLTLPAWLASEFLRRFNEVRFHRVATWDAPTAFGLAHPGLGRRPTAVQLSAVAREADFAPVLEHYFQVGKVPRTVAGYDKAAAKFGLTRKQVKTWLPKTRANRRLGARIDPASMGGVELHNPFRVAKKSFKDDDEGPFTD